MKRYRVVSSREVLSVPCDEKNTPERQLEAFLNKQAEEGWYYRDMVTFMTADHRPGSDYVVLEAEGDVY